MLRLNPIARLVPTDPASPPNGRRRPTTRTEIRRLDGTVETLKACDQTVLDAGEAVIVTTPTAGCSGAN
jgi:5-oxoprolinase (ATP-hydrolysing)